MFVSCSLSCWEGHSSVKPRRSALRMLITSLDKHTSHEHTRTQSVARRTHRCHYCRVTSTARTLIALSRFAPSSLWAASATSATAAPNLHQCHFPRPCTAVSTLPSPPCPPTPALATRHSLSPLLTATPIRPSHFGVGTGPPYAPWTKNRPKTSGTEVAPTSREHVPWALSKHKHVCRQKHGQPGIAPAHGDGC
jgi:hypothetical protein